MNDVCRPTRWVDGLAGIHSTNRYGSWMVAFAVWLLSLTGCASGPSEIQLRAAKARELFEQRCKTAGEKIHRTVENVEGVYLLKLRPVGINYGDQFKLDDPYGSDFDGDAYIRSFLRGFFEKPPANPAPPTTPRLGYLYVEAVDPSDGRRYRYTGRFEEPWQTNKSYLKGYIRFVSDKVPAPGPAPRYGVTYDDISTREEREYWIAGSSLKVIDTQTGEVIAERIGYMVDMGQGVSSGGRAPWLHAAKHSCPQFGGEHPMTHQPGQAQLFVEKVLIPKR